MLIDSSRGRLNAFTTRPELSGTFGAVASTHWIASAVAMRTLELGGNAFDAGTAAGFVLQIVEPHLNGPGGDASILACRVGDAEPTVICGQGPSPAAATIDRFEALSLDLIPGTGLLAPCVPGSFGAWLTLLRDWGSLTLRTILEPAIHYAVHGHPILASAASAIGSVQALFADEWTTSADVFLPKGKVPAVGSLFANPALGQFYTRLLRHSEDASTTRDGQIEAALRYWYEGPVSDTIDRFCRSTEALDISGRRHRGLLTADDLSGWRPPIERPVSVDHAAYTVFKCGAWSQGPAMLQCLRMLEQDDLASMSPEGPEYVHLVTEVVKLAMADRDAFYGDVATVPIEQLLSQEYARARRAEVGPIAAQHITPGSINGHRGRLPKASTMPTGVSGLFGAGEPTMATARSTEGTTPAPTISKSQLGDTCHIDVIDKWGNMVAVTPSGGWLQSSPVIPELGFALGTRMQMFTLDRDHPNCLAPRKRPRTTLTPSIAFREGVPYLAFGTPGGDQQEQWSLQMFLAHVHHGRPLQSAIDAPAMHTDHMMASFWPRQADCGSLVLEDRYPPETIDALRDLGHRITVRAPWSESRLTACARVMTPEGPLLHAAATPRGMQAYAIAR